MNIFILCYMKLLSYVYLDELETFMVSVNLNSKYRGEMCICTSIYLYVCVCVHSKFPV